MPDCSSVVGSSGCIARSGKSIYDALHDTPDFFLAGGDLEAVLRVGLAGLDLNYPLRTRSKVLKSRICEILGYPVPQSFRKSKPRFPGQDFDTYVQKSNNLQIWNEEVVPTRRYVIIRLDEVSKVVGVRVVTGEMLAKLDTTGTLTRKYQAKSRAPITESVLVSRSDAYSVQDAIAALPNRKLKLPRRTNRHSEVDFNVFLPAEALYRQLLRLVGTRLSDPGLDQERNRGAALHRAVCATLGMAESADSGSFPDVLEQLTEVKLQTATTIDLGLVSPDDATPLEWFSRVRHCDIRYAVFYGRSVGDEVEIEHLVLARGADFFSFFQRFEGKVVNAKLQIPLPRDFFG
ncbi:MAG TPA: restriction endonuclease [Verrucomicrobiota bacterium]|nr:restriction endonuclease [Verrucomicrobiota bacterium]HRZ36515.1 restriction endonuclease [Candidatus Paceibacterota bacterium]HRZ54058.1 restriction endonuclease [Candidatus Paceibacterota bacterium]